MEKKINIIARLLTCFILCLFYISATGFSNLNKEKSLKEILNNFGDKYQVFFSYDEATIDGLNLEFEYIEEEDLTSAMTLIGIELALGTN